VNQLRTLVVVGRACGTTVGEEEQHVRNHHSHLSNTKSTGASGQVGKSAQKGSGRICSWLLRCSALIRETS